MIKFSITTTDTAQTAVIRLTDAQTAIYDNDGDLDEMMRPVLACAHAVNGQTGLAVEIETASGIVIDIVQ